MSVHVITASAGSGKTYRLTEVLSERLSQTTADGQPVLRASEVISTYVYKVGLSAGGGDFSYATAIGLFNSVINLAMIVLVNFISRRVSDTSLW